MTGGRSGAVRRESIRVALIATALVAVIYVIVALSVMTVVSGNLTAQVDQRLGQALAHVGDRPDGDADDDPYPRPPGDRPFGPPTLIWTILPSGAAVTDGTTPALPARLATTTTPVSATIDGTEMRLQGGRVENHDVVVAQSLEPVSDARSTILLAEVLVGPVLLAAVFLGAVAIGRRVAAPVEAARERQLDFTADASHELRTPLSVIEAHTTLALAQDRDAVWYRSAFAKVDRESKRMRRLLDDMLWLARFDAARAPGGSEPVDLGTLARQTADRFAAVAETRGLQLRVTVPAEGTAVSAPPEILDRLLGVLLDNACKYAPDGGSVDVAVARDGSRVSLTVDDSGPGIPVEERDRIFDRFHRATGEAAGAGLGLAIGDAIVRATGGRWAVGSAPAGGARFAVSWPRAIA